LDATRVLLTWRPVAGAEGYAIYRGRENEPLQLLGTKTETNFLDSLLTTEQLYRYAVATFDAQQQPQIGPRSLEVRARPSKPPAAISAHFFAPHHVAMRFDEPMHETIKQTALFNLSQIETPARFNLAPESVALSRSAAEVILSFPRFDFSPGVYEIRVEDAEDADRVPINQNKSRAVFTVAKEPSRFYIVSAALESPRQIFVRFNLPVEISSATQTDNYKFKTLDRATPNGIILASVSAVAGDATAVRLSLADGALGPRGKNHVLEISGVRSVSGDSLRAGEGDTIGFAMASANLNRVLVYPNPFVSTQHDRLTIAGLTPHALIKILDVEGRVLATLEETDGNGGVDWDTRDARGNFAPSGVYLCYVTSGTQTTVTKFVIVR
jgi:hypothetical protein